MNSSGKRLGFLLKDFDFYVINHFLMIFSFSSKEILGHQQFYKTGQNDSAVYLLF